MGMGWSNIRKINGEYFRLYKSHKGGLSLDYYLDVINIDDYYIYKSTNTFRRLTLDNIDGKYAGYIFFNKKLYSYKHIDRWIEEIGKVDKSSICYLHKPFPRIEILNKIEII